MIRNLLLSTYLSLKAHKLRVFLTMLGIIIGISSVVTIAALGEGLRQETVKLADTANTNEVKIQHVHETEDEFVYFPEPTNFEFSRTDMKRVQKVEGVASVLPDYGENMGMDGSTETIFAELDYFGQAASTQLTPSIQDVQLAYGRNITASDANKNVIVLSQDVFDYGISIEEPQKMIGQAVSINGYMYEVIGIKESFDDQAVSVSVSGSNDFFTAFNSEVSRASYNELTQFKPIKALRVQLDENTDRLTITERVIDLLTEYHPTEEGVFQEDTMNQQFQQEMDAVMNGLIGFLMAITAISLLVGGIGVMNIMYVSVTQRKREIGIRRAIGAKPRNILFQFIVEAGVITLIGGTIGLLSGYGVAFLIGMFMDLTPILTIRSIILATSVSTLTGLFFGIMPAVSAARMDPIKAIYK